MKLYASLMLPRKYPLLKVCRLINFSDNIGFKQKLSCMYLRINNPWLVCLTAASFFFYQFIQITMFNILQPELIVAFDTNAAVLSFISSLYFYGTVLFLIPAGIILDNISARKIILAAMSLSLIGLFICVNADSVVAFGIGRFMVGISGGPFCFLGSMRLAARWFPEQKLALVTGVIVAMAMFGGMVAQLPFSLLVASLGWKAAMYINLILGAVLLGLVFLIVHDYPAGKQKEYEKQMSYYKSHSFVTGLRTVITRMQNWNCGLFASLLNLPILILGALWGFMYLQQVLGLESTKAATTCAMLFLGMLLGGPTFGHISDRIRLRKPLMYVGALVCLMALVLVLMLQSSSFNAIMILFFIIGFGSSAQILAYPTVTESNPPALTGSALGLTSAIIMGGGAVAQPLIGWLIKTHSNGYTDLSSSMPSYSVAAYHFAFWLMPVAIIFALGFVWYIRETACQPS